MLNCKIRMKLSLLKIPQKQKPQFVYLKLVDHQCYVHQGGKEINLFFFYNKNSLKKMFHNQEFRSDSYFISVQFSTQSCIYR